MSNSRSVMSPIISDWRAFFAPVNRANGAPAIFDPAHITSFNTSAPPAPWIDGGAISNLKRTSMTKIAQLHGATSGGSVSQFRSALDARVEFDFRDWGKVQMAIAGGTGHMNLLAAANGGAPSGGPAVPSIDVLAGSTSTNIVVGTAIVATFNVGDLVAVDVDYTGQTGLINAGIAAAYLRSSAGLGRDYVRRITFNLGCVASKTADALVLEKPLIGGVPAAGAKLQLVTGFVDREGSSFFQEWSAVFISDTQSGGRICFYYPRLQPCAPAAESVAEIKDSLRAMMLHANLLAFPYTDPNDGRQCLCWRSYVPAPKVPAY